MLAPMLTLAIPLVLWSSAPQTAPGSQAAPPSPGALEADLEPAPGLELSLWAETPQLYNPTALDVDERGRVWVTEGVNYRRWNGRNPGLERPGGDRVVVLEDRDGDGRCDSSRVFAQGPELVAPLGILVLGERVLVSCSPTIWEYRDRNGDGDALDPGEREVFLTGFGGHDHDHGVHSLVQGPDGRLYLAVGNAGPHEVRDRSGWTLRSGSLYRDGGATQADNKPGLVSDDGRVYTGGLILSLAPDGTDLRVEAHNFRNPYEVACDSWGNLYTFDNDDEVVCCRASWVLRGGNHGFFSADGSRSWRADQRPGQSIPVAQWHQQDPGVVTSGTLTGAGGPTGVLCVPDGRLPGLRGRFLAADAGRGTVFVFRPELAGAGIELVAEPPLIRARTERESEGARWFRPSDLGRLPDGSLLIADWYDPGVGGHAAGDARCYGRLLRLSARAGFARPEEPEERGARSQRERAAVPRPPTTPEELAACAADADPSARRQALLALRGAPDPAGGAELRRRLLDLARGYDGADRVYLEAFGLACEGREAEVYAWLEPELGAEPAAWDARFAGLAWRLHPPAAVPALAARAALPGLALEERRQALDALAFVPTREAAEAMATLALTAAPDLRALARWWLGNRATNDWRGWVDAASLGGRLEDAELVWSSGLIRRGELEVELDVRGARRLWLVVDEGRSGNSYDWADWLEPRFEGAGGVTRLVDLEWLEARSGWGTTHVGRSCEGGPLVVEERTYEDGIGTHARSEIAYAVPAGAESFHALAAPDDMGSLRAGSTNELEFQVWLERGASRERTRQLLATAFGAEGPDAPSPPAAAGGDPGARRAALRALSLDPEGGLWLLQRAEQGRLTPAEREWAAEGLFRNPDLGVRALASAHFPRPGQRPRPPVESLLALSGDAARGRELFRDPRAQCSTCHAIERGGRRLGGDIGPELTGVGSKFDAARLLDAVLNPSAEIAHGFETWRVETRDGALHSGFILAEGETLVLKDTQGRRHALAADEVVARTRESVSTMPDGVATGLEDDELADLLAFLREDPLREPRFGPEQVLFDGRSLAGWTHHLADPAARPEDVWSVEGGTLVCRGRPAGYLRTEAGYRNFELTLEWRFDPAQGPGNSGVLLRCRPPDKVWPRSIEAQLQHTNAGDLWNIDAFPMAVDLGRTEGRRTARGRPCSERPLGEWNRYRIRLDRDRLTVEVNGVLQNDASWCEELAGPIALQSEGAWIQFRDIRLREILN